MQNAMWLYYSTAFIHKYISLIRVERSTDNTFPTATTYSPHVTRPLYFHQRRALNAEHLAKSKRNTYVVDKCEFSWNFMARIFQQNYPAVHIQGTYNGIPHKWVGKKSSQHFEMEIITFYYPFGQHEATQFLVWLLSVVNKFHLF